MPDNLLNEAAPANETNDVAVQENVVEQNGEEVANPNKENAEAKPEDGKTDKGETEGAPEKYEDFKLPEGFEKDPEVMDEFSTLAKELNITQEKAQTLVDLQTKLAKKQADVAAKKWSDIQDGWRKSAREDAEYGGKNFDASIGIAVNALNTFGNDKLKEVIEQTGMGNNPEFIRFMFKVGKAISEDKVMAGQHGNDGPKDPAKVLYPNMN